MLGTRDVVDSRKSSDGDALRLRGVELRGAGGRADFARQGPVQIRAS